MSTPYRETPVFDEASLPNALRKEHRTKEGVWGRICVIEGELILHYVDPPRQIALKQGDSAIVEPEQTHFVTPISAMKMKVEFHQEPPDG